MPFTSAAGPLEQIGGAHERHPTERATTMITLTVLTAFFAIGFMVHGAITLSKRAMAPVEMAEPVTTMGR